MPTFVARRSKEETAPAYRYRRQFRTNHLSTLVASNTANEIHGYTATRQPATSSETAILIRLARQWLTEYGLDQQLLNRGAMEPATSTELRKSAGGAIIGRFDVTSVRAIHQLFAVAEPDGNITSAEHYESWDYTIWQFDPKHHIWRESYTGGGGGC